MKFWLGTKYILNKKYFRINYCYFYYKTNLK